MKSLGNITSSWVMLLQLARLQGTGAFRDEHSSVAKARVTSQAPGRPGAAVRDRAPSGPSTRDGGSAVPSEAFHWNVAPPSGVRQEIRRIIAMDIVAM